MSNKITALVPMKAHSERVPRKNFREFNGRPLYHWILSTLERVPAIDSIVINTDSDELMEEAPEKFDVKVIERPKNLQGDMVSMNEILLHDVKKVNSDIFLQTHCTNPLLTSETISEAINQFISSDDSDSLFSVTPLQTRLWDKNGEPINHSRDELLRTQDLPPVYEENSNIYIFTQESIEKRQNRIGNSPMMYPIDPEEAIDIDEMIDFKMAEFFHKDKHGENPTLEEVNN